MLADGEFSPVSLLAEQNAAAGSGTSPCNARNAETTQCLVVVCGGSPMDGYVTPVHAEKSAKKTATFTF